MDIVEETAQAATELLRFAVYAWQRDGLVGAELRCRCAMRTFSIASSRCRNSIVEVVVNESLRQDIGKVVHVDILHAVVA